MEWWDSVHSHDNEYYGMPTDSEEEDAASYGL